MTNNNTTKKGEKRNDNNTINNLLDWDLRQYWNRIYYHRGYLFNLCTYIRVVEWSKGVYIITPIFLLFGLLSFAVAIFVPSSKTAAAMYVVPAIVNNEKIQAVGNGIYDLAVEWMKELKPKYKAETNKEETKNKSATQR